MTKTASVAAVSALVVAAAAIAIPRTRGGTSSAENFVAPGAAPPTALAVVGGTSGGSVAVMAGDTLTVQLPRGPWRPIAGQLTGITVQQTFADQALTSDAIAALTALHPEVLRFPAGSHANLYDWRTGTYRVGGEGNPIPGNRAVAQNPLPAVFDLARSIGADVDYVVNLQADMTDLTALVRYMHDNGLHPRYWELGNEPASGFMRPRFGSPEGYIDAATRASAVIRRQFPDAQIALGTQNRDFVVSPWNRALARQNEFQNIVYHRYVGPDKARRQGFGAGNAPTPEDAWNSLLNTSGNKLLEPAERLYSNKHLWVTEWGLLYMRTDVQESVAHAVWMGRSFIQMARTPIVDMAAYWNYNGQPFELVSQQSGFVRRVPYFVFELASSVFRQGRPSAPVDLAGAGDDVTAQAVHTENGHTALFVVNASGRAYAIRLPADAAGASVSTLGAADLAASNGSSTAASPGLRSLSGETVALRSGAVTAASVVTLPPYAVSVIRW